MKHAVFVIFLFLSVATAFAQRNGYTLPSFHERFGSGIRKVVMIQNDGVRRSYKFSRDGRIVEPFWQVYMHKDDGIITRRNSETLTDSIFWTQGGETELTNVLFYRDTSFSDIVKYINGCRNVVLRQTSFNISKTDTTIWLTVDDTNRYIPKPFFTIYKKYHGGEVHLDYSPDSLLISSFRIVYDSRGEVDTIFKWRRYGVQRGCTGRRDTTEWQQVETHRYEYNRRGGIIEDRVYYDDTLCYVTRYKIKYYMRSQKHLANNEEFYHHTVKIAFPKDVRRLAQETTKKREGLLSFMVSFVRIKKESRQLPIF